MNRDARGRNAADGTNQPTDAVLRAPADYDEAGALLRAASADALAALIARLFDAPESEHAAWAVPAAAARRAHYQNRVFVRGLIEITNRCQNDCYYCGIRASNRALARYALTPGDVLAACESGHALGFRSFVLQGGEGTYPDGEITALVRDIKRRHPDCAVTLSLGEKPRAVYQAWFDAGADRYLLRHETADARHYRRLHPPALRLEERMDCLRVLKDIGYQIGAGFMVGSPGQTPHTLAQDLVFLRELAPHMVGIGPFIPQRDTPFGGEPAGTLAQTLVMLSLVRLLLPRALMPSTTALGTIDPQGREKGLCAGANVVMPNLSPPQARGLYALYDNKLATGAESVEGLRALTERLGAAGFDADFGRGDHADWHGR